MSNVNNAVSALAAAAGTLMPYGLKEAMPATYVHFATSASMTQAALELQRAQLLDYNTRLRYGLQYGLQYGLPAFSPYGLHAVAGCAPPGPHDQVAYLYGKPDPRFVVPHEEPKPSHSYIGLIAMAILSVDDRKLVLSDIYQWILDNYSYFRTRGPGWRNSIRHNLSLNDCFIKSGRSANGKGHFWAVHPANLDDFRKGDFRRRRAQRRVRKAMGLSVPDDEDSPSPPPAAAMPAANWATRARHEDGAEGLETTAPATMVVAPAGDGRVCGRQRRAGRTRKRRRFDVESLLAPDEPSGSSEDDETTDRAPAPPAAKTRVEPARTDGDSDGDTQTTTNKAAPTIVATTPYAVPASWRLGPPLPAARPLAALGPGMFPHPSFPLLTSAACRPVAADSVAKWQETVSRAMTARPGEQQSGAGRQPLQY